MQHINPSLKKNYDYWIKQFDHNQFGSEKTISINDALRAHYLLIDYFLENKHGEGVGGVGPRDKNLLCSALGRQFCGYENYQKWTTPLEICATLFYGLIKNHPFHDANKRTALLTLLFHLDKVKRTIDAPQKAFEKFTVDVASNEIKNYKGYTELKKRGKDADVEIIVKFLKGNTRTVDNKFYAITYNELNTILHKYNYGLENLRDNHIDIVRFEKYRKHLFGPHSTRSVKVCQIGMPNWKAQVGAAAIDTVRKHTKLDKEHGVDSTVFFHGADPLNALISTFSGPLKRLADK